MESETMRTKVLRLLKDLGPTEEDVAAALRAARCKGEQAVADKCPVAVYLLERCGIAIDVDGSTVSYRDERRWGRVEAPVGVKAFVQSFDQGMYADLEVVKK